MSAMIAAEIIVTAELNPEACAARKAAVSCSFAVFEASSCDVCYMGVSENIRPNMVRYSWILIMRTPTYGTPSFRKLPYVLQPLYSILYSIS